MRSFFLVIFSVAGFLALLLMYSFVKRRIGIKRQARRRQKRLAYAQNKKKDQFKARITELISTDSFWIEIYREVQPGHRLLLIKERPDDPIRIRFGPPLPNEPDTQGENLGQTVVPDQVLRLICSYFDDEISGLKIKAL